MSEINADNLYTIKTKGFASSHVLNRNFESISQAHNELEGRMRNIETGEPVSDAEIQTARGTYGTLNERLNDIGKERRGNLVIQGMQVIELTYPSEGRVSFTIKKGEVLIEDKIVKVTQNTAFAEIVLDENYRVVVCDTSGVISVLTQETSEFDTPEIGQNKRPLYLFKKEADNEAIFYDCRRWGVMSLMGWHFSLQEAFDDFIVNYFEELHPLGHRHLTFEYTGTANRLETREVNFPTLRSESTMTKSAIATKLEEWTLHVKGREGAVFLIEGLRTLVVNNPQTLGTIIDGRGFKAITVENISFQLPPWHFNALSKAVITATGPIIKDCEMDFETNRTGVNVSDLLAGNKNVYFHTNIKVNRALFKSNSFQTNLGLYKPVGLCINGVLLSHESVVNAVLGSSTQKTSSKTYILVEYNFRHINLDTSHDIDFISASEDRSRLVNSDPVLLSAIASGVTDNGTRPFSTNFDSEGIFYFHYQLYRFYGNAGLLRDVAYRDVSVKLTFKIYSWYRYLRYSPSS